MKKWFSSFSNIITIIILFLLIWRQAPMIIKNFQAEGTKLHTSTYPVIYSASPTNKASMFPPPDTKVIAIFWATWCGPCKIEMERIQSSINSGKISGNQIYAINSFESVTTIKKFLKTKKYSFTFIDAPEIASTLKIEVTPTMLFIDKSEIKSMSSGINFIGIWKMESFLN